MNKNLSITHATTTEALINRIRGCMNNWKSIQPDASGDYSLILKYIGSENAEEISWWVGQSIQKDYIDNFFSHKKHIRDPRAAFDDLFSVERLKYLPKSYLEVILKRVFGSRYDARAIGTGRMYRQIRREMNILIRKEKGRIFQLKKETNPLKFPEFKILYIGPEFHLDSKPKPKPHRIPSKREQVMEDIFKHLKKWEYLQMPDGFDKVLTYIDSKQSRKLLQPENFFPGKIQSYIENFSTDPRLVVDPYIKFNNLLSSETLMRLPLSYLYVIRKRIVFATTNEYKCKQVSSLFRQTSNEIAAILREQRKIMHRLRSC